MIAPRVAIQHRADQSAHAKSIAHLCGKNQKKKKKKKDNVSRPLIRSYS